VTKTIEDSRRAWMWWFVAALAASQLYVFGELLAVFAPVFIAFVPIVALAAGFCVLQNGWLMALARFAAVDTGAMHGASERQR
jgi:hypothetical protein